MTSELDRESDSLALAAQSLTTLESGHQAVATVSAQWIAASITDDDDPGFDPLRFEQEFAQAQAAAARLKLPFDWSLATAPGIGHSDKGMTPFAVRALFPESDSNTKTRSP